MKMIRFIGVFVVMALALCVTSNSHAQSVGLEQVKAIPHFEMSDEEFFDQTIALDETPRNDKYLAYKARIPKGWRKIKSTVIDEADSGGLSRRIMGKVTEYFSPVRTDALSRFEIQAMELDHETTTRTWFLSYILNNGYSLEGIKEHDDGRIEALYVFIERDTAYYVRTIAQMNGPRMVLVSYYTPDQYWEQEKAIQEKVLESFKFISPETVKLEQTRTYAFLDLLRFDYPNAWQLVAPNIYSIEGMDAKIINTRDKETLNGEIEIHVISTELDTTLAQEVKYLQEELKDTGLDIGKLVETPDYYKFHDHIFFNRVEVYEATDSKGRFRDHEYWLGIMVEDRYYYIVTMLSPGRNADFYTWARNTEAFETVIESLRP